ncbi:MAG: DUF4973 domain-containing protein [Tannerellaceae bacterium]
MKYIKTIAAMTLACASLISCNDELKEEQYDKFLSFANSGVVDVYLKYESEGGHRNYKIPVLLSGSLLHDKDTRVDIEVANDTIADLNFDRYRYREDLFFKELDKKHYDFPTMSTVIKKGESTSLIDVNFNLADLDMIDKYILPLKISQTSDFPANPRKWYKRSLMNLILFNDYSGLYSVGGEIAEQDENGNNTGALIKVETRNSWVVDENTIFFYAGFAEEEAIDRAIYRIKATFHKVTPFSGTVELTCDNPDIRFVHEPIKCNFTIEEEMDALLPYLKRIYTTMYLDYSYNDITNPENQLRYRFNGSMVLERKLNILKPEEDQYIFD